MLRVAREGAPGGARAAQRRVQYELLFIRTAVAVGSSGDQSESVLARPEAAASTASLALAKREQGIDSPPQGNTRALRSRSQTLARHHGCCCSCCHPISRRWIYSIYSILARAPCHAACGAGCPRPPLCAAAVDARLTSEVVSVVNVDELQPPARHAGNADHPAHAPAHTPARCA